MENFGSREEGKVTPLQSRYNSIGEGLRHAQAQAEKGNSSPGMVSKSHREALKRTQGLMTLAERAEYFFRNNQAVKATLAIAGVPTVLLTAEYLVAKFLTKAGEVSSNMETGANVTCTSETLEGGEKCTLSFDVEASVNETPTVEQMRKIVDSLSEAGISENGEIAVKVTEESAQTLLQQLGVDVWSFFQNNGLDIGPYDTSKVHEIQVKIIGDSVEIVGVSSDELAGNVSSLGRHDMQNEALAKNRGENVKEAFEDLSGLDGQVTLSYKEHILEDEQIARGVDLLGVDINKEELLNTVNKLDKGTLSQDEVPVEFYQWYTENFSNARGAVVNLDFVVPPSESLLDPTQVQDVSMYTAYEVFAATTLTAVMAFSYYIYKDVVRSKPKVSVGGGAAKAQSKNHKIQKEVNKIERFLKKKKKIISSDASFRLEDSLMRLADTEKSYQERQQRQYK